MTDGQRRRLEGPIVSDALPWIAGLALIALVCANLGWVVGVAVALLAAGGIAFFFRNPDRIVPDDQGIVIAPADGRVIAIERVEERIFSLGDAIRVSIFMSIFDVHVNRMPISAEVAGRRYIPGGFMVADRPLASERNERLALMLRGVGGVTVVLVQVAGIVARRIECLLSPGESLDMGERFGLIRFGSRLDIYLPIETEVTVEVGGRTRAGETILGMLP